MSQETVGDMGNIWSKCKNAIVTVRWFPRFSKHDVMTEEEEGQSRDTDATTNGRVCHGSHSSSNVFVVTNSHVTSSAAAPFLPGFSPVGHSTAAFTGPHLSSDPLKRYTPQLPLTRRQIVFTFIPSDICSWLKVLLDYTSACHLVVPLPAWLGSLVLNVPLKTFTCHPWLH